jgi:hypothetical protein
MTTTRQIEANRANARSSTGPRTEQGKARASRNALRHGLSIPVLADTGLSKQVEDLAHKIAGGNSSASLLEPARSIAEAQVDLNRIRQAQYELHSRELDDPQDRSVGVPNNEPALASSEKKSGTKSVALTNMVRQMARLDRYERRALSRRKFATRAFDAAGVEDVCED